MVKMRIFPKSWVKETKTLWKHHSVNYERFIKDSWFFVSGIENKDTTWGYNNLHRKKLIFHCLLCTNDIQWSCSIQTPSLNTCTSQNVKGSFLQSYTPCEYSCEYWDADVANISLLQRPAHTHRAVIVLCWVTETTGRPDVEPPKRPPSTNQLQTAVVDACQSASAPTKSKGMYLRAWEWRGYQCIAAIGTSCSNRNSLADY